MKAVLLGGWGLAILAGALLNYFFVRAYGDQLACFNLQIDSEIYHRLATDIVHSGVPYVPISHPPGYILFLSLLYRIWGINFLVPKIVFVVCIFITSVVTFLIGRRTVGEKAGLIAGIVISFSPLLRAYSATLQYEVFVMTLLSLTCYCAVIGGEQSCVKRRNAIFLGTGFLLGATILSRETFLVFLPLLTFLGLARRTYLRDVAFLLVPAVGSIVLWVGYQYSTTGQLVPITTKGPVNFFIGNNPNANGTFNLVASTIGEPKGIQFISSEPLRFLELTARRFGYFFGILRDGWAAPQPLAAILTRATAYTTPISFWLLFFRSVLFVLGISAFFCTKSLPTNARKSVWIFATLVACALLSHLFMISSVRFLIPVYPYLALLAGVTLATVFTKRVFIGFALLVSTLGVVFFLDLRGNGQRVLSISDFEGHVASNLPLKSDTLQIASVANGEVSAFVAEEYLPQGIFSFGFEASSNELLSASVSFLINDDDSGCDYAFKTGPLRRQHLVHCYAESLSVIKALIKIEGSQPVTLSKPMLHFGERGLMSRGPVVIFAQGWGNLESESETREFRWSTSEKSLIVFDANAKNEKSISFEVNPFGGEVSARLLVNGRVLSTVRFPSRPWNKTEFKVPADMIVIGPNILGFEFSKTRRPCDFSPTKDCRTLAVGVSNFQVRD